MRSHLVSRVVLKQFADEDRCIIEHLKDSDVTELKSIDFVAYRDIDEAIIKKLEEKWSHEIERQAEKAINNLKAGNVNYFEKHIGVIKSLLALHFIRSQAFQLVEINKKMINDRLKRAMKEVIAAYPEYKSLVEHKYADSLQAAYIDIAVGIMDQYIPKVDSYLSDSDIGFEIGEAPDGSEFIIGDVPVVTATKSGAFGVAITEANAVAMPLTPKHLVALKKNPTTKKYKKLSAQQVNAANRRQLHMMSEHYYSTASFVGF